VFWAAGGACVHSLVPDYGRCDAALSRFPVRRADWDFNWLAGIRVQVEGLERPVPAGVACIFMSNHVSNLDPPVLLPLIPGRTSVFLKRSLMKIPLLGYGMRLAEFVPVDRGGSVEGAQESEQRAKAVLGKRDSHHDFCRRNAFARRAFAAIQEGAVLSGDGVGRALRSDFDFRNGVDDAQGQFAHSARRGAGGLSCAGLSGKGCDRDALMLAVRLSIASGLPEWMRTSVESVKDKLRNPPNLTFCRELRVLT
jgi:1-acyl-sn-glycerol-3-phosphate acyltransferase